MIFYIHVFLSIDNGTISIFQLYGKIHFTHSNSTKIIINCLLKEDKNFLTRKNVKLIFELSPYLIMQNLALDFTFILLMIFNLKN
jgi:hypothetical protein